MVISTFILTMMLMILYVLMMVLTIVDNRKKHPRQVFLTVHDCISVGFGAR